MSNIINTHTQHTFTIKNLDETVVLELIQMFNEKGLDTQYQMWEIPEYEIPKRYVLYYTIGTTNDSYSTHDTVESVEKFIETYQETIDPFLLLDLKDNSVIKNYCGMELTPEILGYCEKLLKRQINES